MDTNWLEACFKSLANESRGIVVACNFLRTTLRRNHHSWAYTEAVRTIRSVSRRRPTFVPIPRGVDPYGTGGTTRPPNIWTGGHYHECPPPNISGVISATFYPCNIFLIS